MNMRAPRWLLPAVAVLILLLAAVTSTIGARHDTGPAVVSPVTGSAPTVSFVPGARPGFGLPTTDGFGTRLDTPVDPQGIVLPQDPGQRPDPVLGPFYLRAAPAGMVWERGWGTAALPFSISDGPRQVRDGVASGFSDTPQGAGLAAWDAFARALAAPEGMWQQVVAQRFTDGGEPLVDRFAASRADNPDTGRNLVVPAGFRIHPDYRPDFAVVDIAVRTPSAIAYSSWPMAWTGGDWRVRVDDIDALWQPATAVTSLADFGVWQ
ncbi:hypothetical protein [Nocardia sp. alder85J]|uniref:hypothetical protein n=1 Tax=Nocardia sp. alder85J TaxID=2862949 RepID=UPI001CD3A588|nr:hypothetical protein [Nocardia sp. alder85J]MCX4098335.1 hypothetical protein [Nocardia sp. alder85J]